MKKIDFHCHTTNRPTANLPPSNLCTISRKMEDHDIQTTVLLATYFPHRGSGISNYRLAAWTKTAATAKSNAQPCKSAGSTAMPRFIMFGSLDFEHYFYQGFNELEELAADATLAGIKIYTGYQAIDLHGKKIDRVGQLASKYRLPILFHTGYCHSMAKENLVKASDISHISTHHGIPVIAAHLAKPNLDDTIRTVKQCANMYADMSGLFYSGRENHEIPQAIDDVRRFVGECGPERLLFGTDYPIQTHEHAITVVEEAMKHYRLADLFKVYYSNAATLLGLARPSAATQVQTN